MLAVLVDGTPVGTQASPVFAVEMIPQTGSGGGHHPQPAHVVIVVLPSQVA
jgi:hypothetical protein